MASRDACRVSPLDPNADSPATVSVLALDGTATATDAAAANVAGTIPPRSRHSDTHAVAFEGKRGRVRTCSKVLVSSHGAKKSPRQGFSHTCLPI